MTRVEDVARYIVNEYIRRFGFIEPLRIHQITILAHYICLERYGRPLFPEAVVFRKLGPRIEELHEDYKQPINKPIKMNTKHLLIKTSNQYFSFINPVHFLFDENVISDEIKSVIKRIIMMTYWMDYSSFKKCIFEQIARVKRIEEGLGIKLNYKEDRSKENI